MAERKIVWTKTAAIQRRSILEYWTEQNGSISYSKKLIELIRNRTHDLLEFPKLGKKADFPNTRVISLGHFSIFYKVEKTEIVITSFWDNRQDPKELLQLLENQKTVHNKK
ncbi:type II toxin-antitoxin system RelE/ParE family toxin [Crocinitomix catalasitica]|nr:type II toxin-antitoxin system RelE/ParE family toxin [Crocinitomix catalasitica]